MERGEIGEGLRVSVRVGEPCDLTRCRNYCSREVSPAGAVPPPPGHLARRDFCQDWWGVLLSGPGGQRPGLPRNILG